MQGAQRRAQRVEGIRGAIRYNLVQRSTQEVDGHKRVRIGKSKLWMHFLISCPWLPLVSLSNDALGG